MSTEPKPVETPSQQMHHQHQQEKLDAETNALGESLISGWQKFKAGDLISYKWMGIILIAVTAIGLAIYIYSEKVAERSKLWIDLESANSRTALEEFAEKYPNTLPGEIAEFDLARFLLGPEGLEKLPTARDKAERKTAVENIEKARELMTKLLEKFKEQPILKVECLVGIAKSEAAFIGLAKDDSPTEFRGSVDALIGWLDKIVEAAGDTPWGEDAKKLSESLKSGGKVKEEFVSVQRNLYASMPSTPFGGGPLAPGKTPLDGGIPGLPGGLGNPITPAPTPITPPKTPDPVPPVKTPDPKAPEPKPLVKTPEPAPPPKTPTPPKK